MNENETLADIVAEMRRGFDKSWWDINHEWAHDLADRIDAAWKRERAEIEANALAVGGVVEAASRKRATTKKSLVVGDMAAMREVVTALAAVILPPRDKAGEDGWLAWVRAMQGKARAALAAPPRNCERFKTKEEAAIAFANEKKQWIPQRVLWELAPWLDWLFETATKGATDGGK